jgi:hypothetical protein
MDQKAGNQRELGHTVLQAQHLGMTQDAAGGPFCWMDRWSPRYGLPIALSSCTVPTVDDKSEFHDDAIAWYGASMLSIQEAPPWSRPENCLFDFEVLNVCVFSVLARLPLPCWQVVKHLSAQGASALLNFPLRRTSAHNKHIRRSPHASHSSLSWICPLGRNRLAAYSDQNFQDSCFLTPAGARF